MKKTLIIPVLFAISGIAFGQHNAGDKNLNIGVGLGSNITTGSIVVPPFGASLEFGVTDEISIGAGFRYTASHQDIGVGTWKYSYMVLGLRGSYHFDIFGDDNIDTYVGVLAGYNVASAKFDGSTSLPKPSAGGIAYSLFLGGRVALVNNIGVFAEIGYGISNVNAGINLKF